MSMEVAISEIVTNGRHRKDMGDLDDLCRSIEDVGLLQPVVLGPGNKLIAGGRRVAAFTKLGRKKIPAVTHNRLSEAAASLKAERDENICRKDFTPSEAVAIGRTLEELERPNAKERQGRAGKPRCDLLPQHTSGRTRVIVGAAVGMSGATYERAKKVVEAAEADPEKFGPLVEEMDRTGVVTAAKRKLDEAKQKQDEESIPESETKRKGVGVLRANEAIDCLKRIPKNDQLRKRGLQIVTDWIRHNK